jgi:phosphinothricin acetyltransferase
VVQAIYAHHVLNGVASFEEIPPDPPEIQRRWEMIAGLGLPFLVAAIDGVVGGYAYAGTYRLRSAYRYAVYVDAVKAGKGLGRAVLSGLITRCSEDGYRQMITVIGDSGNDASIGLHAALGFERVAFLPPIGSSTAAGSMPSICNGHSGSAIHKRRSDPTGLAKQAKDHLPLNPVPGPTTYPIGRYPTL